MEPGLLNALTAGVSSAVPAYQQAKQNAQEQALRQRQQRLQLAQSGFQEGEDGSLSMTPEMQEQRGLDMDLKRAQIEKQLRPEKPGAGRDPLTQALMQERLDAAQRKKDQEAFAKTTKGRYEKEGAETRQKVGFITGALKNLTDYENVFRSGERQSRLNPTTPLVGGFVSSTAIDDNRAAMEEAIGRLQSGGAIGIEEGKTFRNFIPTPSDSDEAAARKLTMFREAMENKLRGYGYGTEDLADLGFDPMERGYGTKYSKMQGRGLLKNEASGLVNRNIKETPGAGLNQQAIADEMPAFNPRERNPKVESWARENGVSTEEAFELLNARASAAKTIRR